ncbi:MAG: hypothetical protein KC561_00530 [Myxococcales bacterium]|nr:hypothetical protein [Myxococcales bacterium]
MSLTPILDQACSVYGDWPSGLLDTPEGSGASAAGFDLSTGPDVNSEAVLRQFDAHCPEVAAQIPRGPNGGIPRPVHFLVGVPGFVGPGEGGEGDAQARFALTARGLGCLAFQRSEGELAVDLAELESTFLSEMGFSLESYITASLANQDDALSRLIFDSIQNCAEEHGAWTDQQ